MDGHGPRWPASLETDSLSETVSQTDDPDVRLLRKNAFEEDYKWTTLAKVFLRTNDFGDRYLRT